MSWATSHHAGCSSNVMASPVILLIISLGTESGLMYFGYVFNSLSLYPSVGLLLYFPSFSNLSLCMGVHRMGVGEGMFALLWWRSEDSLKCQSCSFQLVRGRVSLVACIRQASWPTSFMRLLLSLPPTLQKECWDDMPVPATRSCI